jgi:hypothetical protein
VYTPGVREVFQLEPLDGASWGRILLFTAIFFIIVEFEKLVFPKYVYPIFAPLAKMLSCRRASAAASADNSSGELYVAAPVTPAAAKETEPLKHTSNPVASDNGHAAAIPEDNAIHVAKVNTSSRRLGKGYEWNTATDTPQKPTEPETGFKAEP